MPVSTISDQTQVRSETSGSNHGPNATGTNTSRCTIETQNHIHFRVAQWFTAIAATSCVNRQAMGSAPRMPNSVLVAPSERANSIVAGESVSCV